MLAIKIVLTALIFPSTIESMTCSQSGMNRRLAVQSTIGVPLSGLLGVSSIPPSGAALAPPAAAAATTSASSVLLSDGISQFPLVSFGLQIYNDATAYDLTTMALEVGIRNFFASVLAGNQRGFAKAVRDSNIPRSELFICGSVVSNRALGYDAAKQATTRGWQENMNAFAAGNIDYLDQIMLDYPGPDCESIRGQWSSFESMAEQKFTRSLAVSNFSPSQLDCILSKKDLQMRPVVNQLPYSIAYHPDSSYNAIEENSKRGVLVQAWAPLGGSLGGRFTPAKQAACATIGEKYGKSYAQVALRWIIQTGAAFATQTKKREHFVEDLNVFDFELSKEDMLLLSSL